MTLQQKLIYFLLIVPNLVFALNPSAIQIDQKYSSKGMINLRATPPKTIFYILGDKKGLVNKNDSFKVKEIKEIKTLFDKHYWLKIERINPKTMEMETGWIYGGKAGGESLMEVAK